MSKRRIRTRQGISALVSAVLLVGMLLTTSFAYFLFEVRAQRAQSAALDFRLRVDQQQAMERFNVTGEVSGIDTVAARAINSGPIPIQIAYLIVINTTDGSVAGFNNTIALANPVYVDPGKRSELIVSDAPFNETTNYSIGILTARGTIVYTLFPTPRGGIPGVIQEGLTSLDTGSIVISFFSIKYRQKTGPNWGPWQAGWLLPVSKDTLWVVNVTNIDTSRDLYVNEFSNFYLIQARGARDTILFYIMRVQPGYPSNDSTPALFAYSDANRVVIPHGTWVLLYFGVKDHGADPNQGGSRVSFAPGDANKQFALFFLISGNWDSNTGEPYGQNIPFEGVRTEP